MPTNELTGFISNIQHWTVHDGPGVRTGIFFKGCPLKCMWCSNPEGINKHPEVGVFGEDCIGLDVCGACIKVCPKEALLASGNQIAGIDRALCVNCLSCAKACPTKKALKVYGTVMTVSELMGEIRKDRNIYQRTGGGVTLSGGDCLEQAKFVQALLQECKRARIHTCVETELCCSTETLDSILPYTDLLMTDIKHMDPVKHRQYCGVSNKPILSNITYLAMKNVPMIVRYPVIPGYNDDEENIEATATFLIKNASGSLRQLQLLPYRPLGLEKYRALNRPYPMEGYEVSQPGEYLDRIRKLAAYFRERAIPASAGTTERPE